MSTMNKHESRELGICLILVMILVVGIAASIFEQANLFTMTMALTAGATLIYVVLTQDEHYE